MTKEQHRARLLSLMNRYCELGRLLDPDFTVEYVEVAIGETKLILSEIRDTQAEIDALLAKQN